MKIIQHVGPKESIPIICLGYAESLRIGVFFDGTGNHTAEASKWSNVYKLKLGYIDNYSETTKKFEVNPQDFDIPCTSIYKRGVGTDKDAIKKDALGSAMAAGMEARLKGMMYDLKKQLERFKATFFRYPVKVELDIFGFSRGAATARHFANVILQRHFNLGPDKALKAINYEINFLGLFDTVGSVGVAGNSYEPGYSLYVDPSINKVVHLIAEDEYRANFDLTSATSKQDKHYPLDTVIDGNIEEILLPGAHSDIGGGYAPTYEHDIENNRLSRMALSIMYSKGLKSNVAFLKKSKLFKDSTLVKTIWNEDEKISKYWQAMLRYYNKYPGLRVLYKQYREVDITLASYMIMNRDNVGPSLLSAIASLKREAFIWLDEEFLIEYKKMLHRLIRSKLKGDAEGFLSTAKYFYLNYVHKSIFPWNTTTGMWAQPYNKTISVSKKDKVVVFDGDVYHREIFHAEKIKLVDKGYTMAGLVGEALELFDEDRLEPKKFHDDDHGK